MRRRLLGLMVFLFPFVDSPFTDLYCRLSGVSTGARCASYDIETTHASTASRTKKLSFGPARLNKIAFRGNDAGWSYFSCYFSTVLLPPRHWRSIRASIRCPCSRTSILTFASEIRWRLKSRKGRSGTFGTSTTSCEGDGATGDDSGDAGTKGIISSSALWCVGGTASLCAKAEI